jgi:hypothetical protein
VSRCLLYDSWHAATVEPGRSLCATPDNCAKSRNLLGIHRLLNSIILGEVEMLHDRMLVSFRTTEGLKKQEVAVARVERALILMHMVGLNTPQAQLLQLNRFHDRTDVGHHSCL